MWRRKLTKQGKTEQHFPPRPPRCWSGLNRLWVARTNFPVRKPLLTNSQHHVCGRKILSAVRSPCLHTSVGCVAHFETYSLDHCRRDDLLGVFPSEPTIGFLLWGMRTAWGGSAGRGNRERVIVSSKRTDPNVNYASEMCLSAARDINAHGRTREYYRVQALLS